MADRSGESLSSSLAAEFISNSGEQTQRQHWYDRPHGELVDSVKQAIASARADSEAKGHHFDPIKWVGLELTRTIGRASGDAMQKRLDASLAWDAISLP